MTYNNIYDIVVIGGGLAGLTAALHLGQHKVRVLVIEKYTYPHHKVCGEYVSNEILYYLNSLGVHPKQHGAVTIDELRLTTLKGKKISAKLPLGGFGISRYTFDDILYKQAKKYVDFLFDTVSEINFLNEIFNVKTTNNVNIQSKYVVGAYGKRSNLDKNLKRKFIAKKTPWLAVKAHYKYDMDENVVALHAFKGGYCGLSKTESGVVNACYLTTAKEFKKYTDIRAFQNIHISENPALKTFFANAIPEFEKPLAISQISFSDKESVYDHIFMIGDTAGLIHPLCGNGMAMAIHSAKLFCELYLETKNSEITRTALEDAYKKLWQETFSSRLKIGAVIQKILLHPAAMKVGFGVAGIFPKLIPAIIKQTHGTPIV